MSVFSSNFALFLCSSLFRFWCSIFRSYRSCRRFSFLVNFSFSSSIEFLDFHFFLSLFACVIHALFIDFGCKGKIKKREKIWIIRTLVSSLILCLFRSYGSQRIPAVRLMSEFHSRISSIVPSSSRRARKLAKIELRKDIKMTPKARLVSSFLVLVSGVRLTVAGEGWGP